MDFKSISLTGRLCYLFMCIERYLITCYPDRDWTPAAKRCWQWTNRYWNDGCDIYAPVVPEFLLEYDNYEDANRLAFDAMLSREDYAELTELYDGITDGESENEINCVLYLPVDFANACEGTNFDEADKPTIEILEKMLEILRLHGIEPPYIDNVADMTVEQKDGWGDFTDSEYLSVILNGG
ncbi:MAG: hypothetical protein HDT42_07070 [Ruminococcaceae bacterium]|nr:hypothetical protein [Oscillospiraceae bacterium]